MSKILSVSIAAYNVQSTLEEALLPFTKSKYKEKLDIMIINDGSKDGTADIAKRYEQKFPGVFRLINKENGGWGSTLNVGMKEASGKYFKQLDGDDYFSEENLDGYIEFLSECDADIVHTPYVAYDDKTGSILRSFGAYGKNILPQRRKVKFSELDGFIPAMHTLTVRTQILKDNPINITEHCFYTDVEFLLKVCNYSETVMYYELPIYYYRLARNGQSMSVEGVRKHYKDHLKMLKTMLEYEKKNVDSEWRKKLFRLRLENACDMQYKFFFALKKNGQAKKEVQEFDKMLRDEYPYYYEKTKSRIISSLRNNNFIGYNVFARVADSRYKKLKLGIYEGC
ncbi:MAG: glycosyltransferase family 2 protein [Alistipes sp.]|nr:glycosyltransferase family 2 protein [Alistipes sp.]